MELEEIFEHWNKDCVINNLDLGGEALKIPQLHNKYLKFLSVENSKLKKLEFQYKKLAILKHDYFNGVLNGTEELEKLGWPPMLRTILKADVPKHVEADSDIQKILIMIETQKEKVDVLTSIMKEIMSRNFIIKSAIDMLKFNNGVI